MALNYLCADVLPTSIFNMHAIEWCSVNPCHMHLHQAKFCMHLWLTHDSASSLNIGSDFHTCMRNHADIISSAFKCVWHGARCSSAHTANMSVRRANINYLTTLVPHKEKEMSASIKMFEVNRSNSGSAMIKLTWIICFAHQGNTKWVYKEGYELLKLCLLIHPHTVSVIVSHEQYEGCVWIRSSRRHNSCYEDMLKLWNSCERWEANI